MLSQNSELYFIRGNVPALKNGKQWTGKYLVKSKRVTEYLKSHGIKHYSPKDKVIEPYKSGLMMDTYSFATTSNKIKTALTNVGYPYKLGFHFLRESKHSFDFGNAVELISDLFTAANVWEDDNINYFLPFPLELEGRWYSYDKNNPGVFIKILN